MGGWHNHCGMPYQFALDGFKSRLSDHKEMMMLLKSIIGWRDELDQLRNGPAYKAMYPSRIRNPQLDPLVPKSVLLDFVETLLAHEETRSALIELNQWHKANPPDADPDPEADPTFPHRASNLTNDFINWYMLKTGHGPRLIAYIMGLQLATGILDGQFANSRSPEADTFLRTHAKHALDFNH